MEPNIQYMDQIIKQKNAYKNTSHISQQYKDYQNKINNPKVNREYESTNKYDYYQKYDK